MLLVLSILDELVETVPGVAVFVGLKIVVEGIDNCLGALVHVMPDDFTHTPCRVPYVIEVEWLVIGVQQISLGEVLEAVGRK